MIEDNNHDEKEQNSSKEFYTYFYEEIEDEEIKEKKVRTEDVLDIKDGVVLGAKKGVPYIFIDKIELPEGVVKINTEAFAYWSGLEIIIFPSTLVEICDSAFRADERLVIPNTLKANNLKKIGDYAFYMCPRLPFFAMPNSVTEVGKYAFSLCRSLERVIYSDNLTSFSEGMFSGCISLSSCVRQSTFKKAKEEEKTEKEEGKK